jgi:GGDEF domain-containing protein
MTESQLIHALAAAARRLSQPGAAAEIIDDALLELRSTAGVDCVLTDGGVDVRWPDDAPAEPRGAFEEAVDALVGLAREAHGRDQTVLDGHAFELELRRCTSAARWRDKRVSVAVFEVEGISLGPGIDGTRVVDLVGAAARTALRHGDLVGHLGASRFALLFPRAGTFEARAAYRRVQQTVAEIAGEQLSCSAAGFAELGERESGGNLLGEALARLSASRLRRSYTGPFQPGSPTQPLAG